VKFIIDKISYLINKSKLPKEGSLYTYKNKNSLHNETTGIVHHQNCGKRFMLKTSSGWITNIKLKNK
jgi:hypothetical protein